MRRRQCRGTMCSPEALGEETCPKGRVLAVAKRSTSRRRGVETGLGGCRSEHIAMSNEDVREVRAGARLRHLAESGGPKAIGFRPFEIQDG